METVQSETIPLASGDIHYLEAGKPENTTVLLLHGMSFTAETWKELGTIELLAREGYHAVAVEMPGFGRSPASDARPGTVLKEFLAQKAIEAPVLVGPSMGGRISLEFCLVYPDLVGGLILIGPVGVKENASRLPEIGVPCLAIWGGDDTISPPANAEIIESRVKDSKTVIFPGAPHPCYLQETDKWHETLLSFLKSNF
jgi:abhydrolase domain-containing protein 14